MVEEEDEAKTVPLEEMEESEDGFSSTNNDDNPSTVKLNDEYNPDDEDETDNPDQNTNMVGVTTMPLTQRKRLKLKSPQMFMMRMSFMLKD